MPARQVTAFLLASALGAWSVELWHYSQGFQGADVAALAGLLLARGLWSLLPLAALGVALARWAGAGAAWAAVLVGWAVFFLYAALDLACQRLIGAHILPFLWFFYDVLASPEGEGMKFAGGTAALALPIVLTVAVVALLGAPAVWLTRRFAERIPRTRTLAAAWAGLMALGMAANLAWSDGDVAATARQALPAGSGGLLSVAAALAPRTSASQEEWLQARAPEAAALLSQALQARPAAPPSPPRPGRRPHVVVLVVESWRADRGGLRDSPLDPWLDRGLHLTRHYSGSNTSHLGLYSLLYGRNPILYKRDLDAHARPLLPAILKNWGYSTLFMSSSAFQGWKWQERFLNPRTFDRLEGAEEVQTDWQDWPRRDRDFLRELPKRLRTSQHPMLAVVFLQTTHFPYAFPPEFALRKPCLEGQISLQNFATSDPAEVRNRYANACAFMDDEVARFLDTIDLQDTLVVLTGDHGESFWEDGALSHGTRASEAQLRVPALMIGAGLPARRMDHPSTHADLLPTLIQHLAGGQGDLPGVSGRDLLHLDRPGPVLVCPLQSCPPYELDLLSREEGASWRVLQARRPRLRPDLGPDSAGLAMEFAGGLGRNGEPRWDVPRTLPEARAWQEALETELRRLIPSRTPTPPAAPPDGG